VTTLQSIRTAERLQDAPIPEHLEDVASLLIAHRMAMDWLINDLETREGKRCPVCDGKRALLEHTATMYKDCGNNLTRAAEKLGVSAPTVRSRLDQLREWGKKIESRSQNSE